MGIDKKESVLLLIFQSEACTGHGAAAAVVVQYLDDPRVGPIQFQRRLLHSADGAIREWGERERAAEEGVIEWGRKGTDGLLYRGVIGFGSRRMGTEEGAM